MEVRLIDWMPCVAEITFKCPGWVGCHEAYYQDGMHGGRCTSLRDDGTCTAAERLVGWYRSNGHPFPWSSRGGVPQSVLQIIPTTPCECSCHHCTCGNTAG